MRKGLRLHRLFSMSFCLLLIFLATAPIAAQNSEGGIFQMVGNITIQEDQVIDGDVNTMAGNITVYGTVLGDVTSVAGNITIHGKVDGDVQTTGGNIYLKSTAEVSGDATVLGGNVYKDPGSKLRGSVTQIIDNGGYSSGAGGPSSTPNIRIHDIQISPHLPWYFLIWGAVTGLISWLALGAFMMLFFSRQVTLLAKKVDERPGYYFAIGLVSYIVFPPLFVLMLVTIVGIPLAFVLLLVVFLGTLFGQLAVARSLGQRINRRFDWKFDTEMGQVLVGLVAIFLISVIPVIGWVFFLATACIGLGTAVVNRFGVQRKPKSTEEAPLIDPKLAEEESVELIETKSTDLVEQGKVEVPEEIDSTNKRELKGDWEEDEMDT